MNRARDIYEKIKSLGLGALDEFFEGRESESLFLDFKQSADNGTGVRLHPDDRKNLSRAISGFGNSEGGVLVWGVDCRADSTGADVASAKVPIQDVKKFISLIEGAVSGCTMPACVGVENFPIDSGEGKGFVVTYIPKSVYAPHQAVYDYKYYMRSGSAFSPVPHGVLAGMFGKRPEANVFVSYLIAPSKIEAGAIKVEMGFIVHNSGPGIAHDAFIKVDGHYNPGPNCQYSLKIADKNWTGYSSFGRITSLISKPDFRMPPESSVQPIILELAIKPPFASKFRISGLCGAANSTTFRFEFENLPEDLLALYNEGVGNHASKPGVDNYWHELSERILNIPEPHV